MVLRILFFSVLQDVVGCEELEFEAPGTVHNVGELLDALYQQWPSLRGWQQQIRVAVDLDYVGLEHLLKEGQEIAIMPPVQGG